MWPWLFAGWLFIMISLGGSEKDMTRRYGARAVLAITRVGWWSP